jgi:hypothetical protein
MNRKIFDLSPIRLDPSSGLRRESPRAPEFRQPDFDERFDSETLFYDVFRHPDRSTIMMIGPSLYNLASLFDDIEIRALPSGSICRFRRYDLDRLTRVDVDAPAGTSEIVLHAGKYELHGKVSPPETATYESLRVLYAISKNNDITWICDWARFNRDVHGAQALLIYDNQSTDYQVDELLHQLGKVGGLAFVGVVPLPFRFGPPGLGLRKNWDSNFLQIGSLELARWRFLLDAKSFLNTDIDELVIGRGGASVFDAAERSGLVRFYGRWVPNIRDDTVDPAGRNVPRHANFSHVETARSSRWPPLQDVCQPKWAVAPRRVPANAHMTHHRIKSWWRSRLWNPNFSFRHFRGLSTGWKYERGHREAFDPQRHRLDGAMKEAFARVHWDE